MGKKKHEEGESIDLDLEDHTQLPLLGQQEGTTLAWNGKKSKTVLVNNSKTGE